MDQRRAGAKLSLCISLAEAQRLEWMRATIGSSTEGLFCLDGANTRVIVCMGYT